jgi:hypothetical protein
MLALARHSAWLKVLSPYLQLDCGSTMGIAVAADPTETDVALLSDLAGHAHRLLGEFIALPCSEADKATELLNEMEHVIAEFKRLRPPPPLKRGRLLRLAETHALRHCSICEQPVDRKMDNYFETEGAIYHCSCYDSVVSEV